VTDLRTNTASGQWLDIQKAAMTGGEVEDNPIFDGSLGVYNGAILHEDVRVTPGAVGLVSYPNVRRAVMAGAQSATMAFGRDNGPNRYTWVEELFDYENQLGVAAGLIWGLKKTNFNGFDFGTIVTSSYAAAH
jgi:N4-gp56 family major capsid protein